MLARGVTREDVEAAAEAAGVRAVNVRADGRGWRFRLKTSGPTTDGKPVRFGRYARRAARLADAPLYRVPGAVCWHGFREYIRALYKRAPEATVATGLATYHGARHFEASHPATYGERPTYFGFGLNAAAEYLCDCEKGEA